jgi:hypothetical protein
MTCCIFREDAARRDKREITGLIPQQVFYNSLYGKSKGFCSTCLSPEPAFGKRTAPSVREAFGAPPVPQGKSPPSHGVDFIAESAPHHARESLGSASPNFRDSEHESSLS